MASPTRVSGMVSGIDTESVVQAYVQSYVDKKTKIQQSQTKLSYKQDAWKALNTKVYSLYSKVGNLRFSNSYNLKKTTVSDATKASVSASSNAVVGTQTLKISQLAKAGYLTGAQLAKNTTASTTLASLGFTDPDAKISVRVGGGAEKEISLSGSSKISDVVDALKNAGVNASYDANNQRIFVSAKSSGAANDFAITANSDAGTSALSALGLLTYDEADLKGYAASAAIAQSEEGMELYEVDDDGNVKFDANGKPVLAGGGQFDETNTKTTITQMLEGLANAYNERTTLTARNAELSASIEYANAYNTVHGAGANDVIDLLDAKKDGALYVDGTNTYKHVKELDDGGRIYYNESDDEVGAKTVAAGDAELKSIDDAIEEKAENYGLIEPEDTDENGEVTTPRDTSAYDEFVNAYNVLNRYKGTATETDEPVDVASTQAEIDANNAKLQQGNELIAKYSYWDVKDYSSYYNEDGDLDISDLADTIYEKVKYASGIIDGSNRPDASVGATRVTAQDAVIYLNGAEYTSSNSNFNINGLNISALAVTDNDITISTTQDNQGIYDKVKDFLSQYNELINEMQSLYNADSAKGYEPLTDDQKDSMSDKEVEKWEDKIKDSILRRDSSLGTLISKMTAAMSRPITVNGRGYSLSDFGIQTLGYLNASKNQQYAYHIYGDEDDTDVASKPDKLMSMINSDPDTVIEFMQDLSANLYNAVGGEMKSSKLRTAYTVYNDKQMAKDYTNYTKSIKEWETKIADMEDRYYKRFSAMESALAKMQNATSSLSTLLGN